MWPICRYLEEQAYAARVKGGCELVGHPVGPPRLPLRAVASADQARLAELLREAEVSVPAAVAS